MSKNVHKWKMILLYIDSFFVFILLFPFCCFYLFPMLENKIEKYLSNTFQVFHVYLFYILLFMVVGVMLGGSFLIAGKEKRIVPVFVLLEIMIFLVWIFLPPNYRFYAKSLKYCGVSAGAHAILFIQSCRNIRKNKK